MAQGQISELFSCTPEQLFKIITDYESYPEFLQEVKKCQVLKTDGDRKIVEYTVSVLKSFKYQMAMTEKPSDSVVWEFVSGDLFKTSSGSWSIVEENGKARATYKVEATFNMFVPGPIEKALLNVNLPNMVSAYQKRIQTLYGR